MTARATGQIITFYSYKGGVGRSMALANIAWILAANGRKVLAIDWDLEAPGLHRYFRPFLIDSELFHSEGVIDFVWDLAVTTMSPVSHADRPAKRWIDSSVDISRLAVRLDWEFGKTGLLDFIPSGRQGSSYSQRVNEFDWIKFYQKLGGGRLLEATRKRIKIKYDYVLIDSRTGVSDTSGICTLQMPDVLVACTTLNNQSLSGVASVLKSVREQRGGEVKFFPAIMRVELSEKDKLDTARNKARESLGEFLPLVTSGESEEYWKATEVLYQPFYAYEEVLATFGDSPGSSSTSLLSSMERLGGRVTGIEGLAMPEIGEGRRRQIIEKYALDARADDVEGISQMDEEQPKPLVVNESGYEFEVFLSYRRLGLWPEWIKEHFLPVSRFYLGEDLGREPRIFADSHLEGAASWPEALSRALARSKVLVPLFSKTYFNSPWCLTELKQMLYREKVCGWRSARNPHGLIFPAIIHAGMDAFPVGVRGIQAVALNDYANVRMSRQGAQSEQMALRIREWTPRVSSAILGAPAWDSSWGRLSIESSETFLNQPLDSGPPSLV